MFSILHSLETRVFGFTQFAEAQTNAFTGLINAKEFIISKYMELNPLQRKVALIGLATLVLTIVWAASLLTRKLSHPVSPSLLPASPPLEVPGSPLKQSLNLTKPKQKIAAENALSAIEKQQPQPNPPIPPSTSAASENLQQETIEKSPSNPVDDRQLQSEPPAPPSITAASEYFEQETVEEPPSNPLDDLQPQPPAPPSASAASENLEQEIVEECTSNLVDDLQPQRESLTLTAAQVIVEEPETLAQKQLPSSQSAKKGIYPSKNKSERQCSRAFEQLAAYTIQNIPDSKFHEQGLIRINVSTDKKTKIKKCLTHKKPKQKQLKKIEPDMALAILKDLIREMNLFSGSLQNKVFAFGENPPAEKKQQIEQLIDLVSQLPKTPIDKQQYLQSFITILHRVSCLSNINKMNAKVIARSINDTLSPIQDEGLNKLAPAERIALYQENANYINVFTEALIEYYPEIFLGVTPK